MVYIAFVDPCWQKLYIFTWLYIITCYDNPLTRDHFLLVQHCHIRALSDWETWVYPPHSVTRKWVKLTKTTWHNLSSAIRYHLPSCPCGEFPVACNFPLLLKQRKKHTAGYFKNMMKAPVCAIQRMTWRTCEWANVSPHPLILHRQTDRQTMCGPLLSNRLTQREEVVFEPECHRGVSFKARLRDSLMCVCNWDCSFQTFSD